MISRLRGKAVASDAEGLVLDVGGVGYRIAATPSALRKAEGAEETVIETHLHVREDALQLAYIDEHFERQREVHGSRGQSFEVVADLGMHEVVVEAALARLREALGDIAAAVRQSGLAEIALGLVA